MKKSYKLVITLAMIILAGYGGFLRGQSCTVYSGRQRISFPAR